MKDLIKVETFCECVSNTGSAQFCLTKVNIMLKKKENLRSTLGQKVTRQEATRAR
jgi:hypothetical protein